jgi:hypothetical protein
MARHGSHILQANRERILAQRQALRTWQQRQPKTPFEAWQRSLTAEPWGTGATPRLYGLLKHSRWSRVHRMEYRQSAPEGATFVVPLILRQ